DWEQAPGARACHPREEHLIPLLLAAGAAGEDSGQRDYSDRVMGKALSGFRFG
ncbi:dioxygenase, partial [Roseomonas sp. DSM 102946]|nr:dioxygenase [Roseomonas sp. DSM 102946]